MIPVKYLEELKTAPVEEVDFVATFIEVGLRQMHIWSDWVELMRTDVRRQIYHHGQPVNLAPSSCQSATKSPPRYVCSWTGNLRCLFIDRGYNTDL